MSEPPEHSVESPPASFAPGNRAGDRDYPGPLQAVLLTGLAMLTMVLMALVLIGLLAALDWHLGYGLQVVVVNTFAIGLVLLWGCRRTGLPFSEVLRFDAFTPRLVVPLLVFTLGASIVLSELDNLLRAVWPMPEWAVEAFGELMDSGWGGLLAVVVVAPVSEELLFRGLILRGLIVKRGVAGGIFYSSLLFGFLHLNPWQFSSAFLLGIVLGWLFVRTRSLWPCILLHAVFNGLVMVVSVYAEPWGFAVPGYTGVPFDAAVFQPPFFDLLGLVLVVVSLASMRSIFVRDAKRAVGDF